MINFDIDFGEDFIKENETSEQCRGMLYRCRVSQYFGSAGDYVERVSMVPLKSISCKGCEYCLGTLDALETDIGLCQHSPCLGEAIDGGLYMLQITNISTDWESGIVDEFDVTFELVEDDGESLKG